MVWLVLMSRGGVIFGRIGVRVIVLSVVMFVLVLMNSIFSLLFIDLGVVVIWLE